MELLRYDVDNDSIQEILDIIKYANTIEYKVNTLEQNNVYRIEYTIDNRIRIENINKETNKLEISITELSNILMDKEIDIVVTNKIKECLKELYKNNYLGILRAVFNEEDISWYTSISKGVQINQEVASETDKQEETTIQINQEVATETDKQEETTIQINQEVPSETDKILDTEKLNLTDKQSINKSGEQVNSTIQLNQSQMIGCSKCNYTGFIKDINTGLRVKCNCQVSASLDNKKAQEEKTTAIKVKISNTDKFKAVIPKDRREDEFNIEFVKDNISKMAIAQGYKIIGFNGYINIINLILTQINNYKLTKSYIIGAPNGFGTTTFVYTAIKRLLAQDKKVVPYISLSEIAEKKIEYDNELLARLRKYNRGKIVETDSTGFNWKDYLEADVLFTYLSSLDSKQVESSILNTLLKIRGNNGKATIVIINTTLKAYLTDNKIKEYYWDEMLEYNTKLNRLDRLTHISTYKRYNYE